MRSLRLAKGMGYTISGGVYQPQMSSKHRGHHRSYPGWVGDVSILADPVERRLALASSLGRVKWRQASICLAGRARKKQQLKGEKYVICPSSDKISRYTRMVFDRARRLCPESSDVLYCRPEIGRLDQMFRSAQSMCFISHAACKGEQRRAFASSSS